MRQPDLFPSHIKRINNANLKYPILVVWPSNKDKPVDVVDGLHRLVAHVLLHTNEIPVQRVTQLQLDETRLETQFHTYSLDENTKTPKPEIKGPL